MRQTAERTRAVGKRERTLHRRSTGLVLVAAVAAVGLAGCGGSKAPSVASITSTNTKTTSTGTGSANRGAASRRAVSKRSAVGLLSEWAACMRSHGDPDQTAPKIDNHYGINVVIPPGAPESLSNEVHGGTAPCNEYLAAASNALKAEHPAPPPPSANASGVRYSACMRANGVPNYPDPPSTGHKMNLRGIDMNSPFFIRANKLCGKKIGAPAWWINGWGPPGNISVTNIPPGCLPQGNSTKPPPGCLPPAGAHTNGTPTTTPSATPTG